MDRCMLLFPSGIVSTQEIVCKSICPKVSFDSTRPKQRPVRLFYKQPRFSKAERLLSASYLQKSVCQASFHDGNADHPSVNIRPSTDEPFKPREDVVAKQYGERSTTRNVRKIWVRRRDSPFAMEKLRITPSSKEGNDINSSGHIEQAQKVVPSAEDANTGKDYVRLAKDFRVKVNELVPGATFTGKVTNVQPYGAFVDIGAFTSGLIHISNMSRTYIRNVEDIVKLGQEVKVEVMFVDVKSRRISFRLKIEGPEQIMHPVQKPSSPKNAHPKGMNNDRILPKKPQEGDVLTGTITKIIASGVFVKLQDHRFGFLPATEVLSGSDSVETNSYFRLGQQIPVRVLCSTKDQIQLSMKKQVERKEEKNSVTVRNQENRATSPFEIAFRQDKVLARYLDEIERIRNVSKEIDIS